MADPILIIGIEVTTEGVRARFASGDTASGAALVGADGIRSVVRGYVLGDDPLRYSGHTCFRGIAHVPLKEPDVMREIQGVA